MLIRVLILAALFGLCSVVGAEEVVILKHDMITITDRDVARYLDEKIPKEHQQEFVTRPGRLRDLIENIYVIKKLSELGAKHNLMDDEQLAWQLQFHKDRLLSTAYLERYIDAKMKSINWDASAKEVYLIDGQKFLSPEKVRASHILIKPEGRSDEEALALANALRERALKGEDFTALASEYSEDPSKEHNAGNLGAFARGQMVPEFEKAAFAMDTPDSISEVVQTSFGYHVIKVHEKIPAQKLSFEDSKSAIVLQLKEQMEKKLRQDKLIEIRSTQGVEINPEGLKALEQQYGVAKR